MNGVNVTAMIIRELHIHLILSSSWPFLSSMPTKLQAAELPETTHPRTPLLPPPNAERTDQC